MDTAVHTSVRGGAAPDLAPSAGRRRLHALTSLRFFAALAVFLHHTTPLRHHGLGWGVLWEGASGVTFFFVLSGFVLAYGYADRLQGLPRGAVRRFYVARFARIYPVFFLTFALAAAPTFVDRLRAGPSAMLPWAFQLTLTQSFLPLVDSFTGKLVGIGFDAPAWSLSCEMFFYALFPFFVVTLLRFRRPAVLAALAAVLWIWPFAIAAGFHGTVAYGYWFVYIFPFNRMADFMVGVCLGLAMLRTSDSSAVPQTRRWTLIEGASLTALLGAVALSGVVSQVYRYDAWYVPPMAVVIVVFALGRGRLSAALSASWLVFLGEISFSFYMLHTLVMRAAGYQPGNAGGLANVAPYVLILGVTLGLSALAYMAYERPLQRLINRRLGATHPPTMHALVATPEPYEA